MRGPFGARLKVPGRPEIEVSEELTGFTYRSTAPGGFAGAQGKLWLSTEQFDIGPMSKLTITDARHAGVLWEGYLDNPGDSFDENGQAFDLSAQGAQTLVGDQAECLLYLDAQMSNWRSDDRNDSRLAPSSEASAGAWPDTEQDALMLQFGSGSPVGKGDEARIIHDLADSCPMGVGGYSFRLKCGITANGYDVRVRLSNNTGNQSQLGMDSTVQTFDNVVGSGTFPNPGDILKLVLRRIKGATNVGTDRIWAGFADPYVVGNRKDRHGNVVLDGSTDMTSIKASDVVEDLIYRMMPMIDPYRCWVDDSGTFEIDQLTYADPVRATGVLEDLELFEPDFQWRVGASNSQDLHEFRYVDWPTTPRYEISIQDGYEAPGGDTDLCNRIVVGYVGRRGQKRSKTITTWVPELGGTPANPLSDRIRDADRIELDEAVSSAANAQRIGEQVLRLKNNPPKAATANIARHVWDRKQGCLVAPWEIEPGFVARVRETGEDLRITETEVDTDACTNALTLGVPQPSIEQLVARLARVAKRTRKG